MKNDIIACPNGVRSVAHQIINNSNADLKYLPLSAKKAMKSVSTLIRIK